MEINPHTNSQPKTSSTFLNGSPKEFGEKIRGEMHKVIIGQDEIIECMLIALLCKGHILLEGVPGTAKTLMVRTLAITLNVEFGRIQFTPDLMPSDILGTNVFNLQTNTFHLSKGPIFTNLVLADEINRTPAKTQSALLEAMEERYVTIDGTAYPVGDPFVVFATQNPIEYEGTYPLPEAQLDRFLLKVNVGYPSEAEEDKILAKFHEGFDSRHLDLAGVESVTDSAELNACVNAIKDVVVEDSLLKYIRQIIQATRDSNNTLLGASPRASIHLLLTSKAAAALQGKGFVTPDEIKRVSYPVLRHRLILQPEAQIEGITADDVITNVLDSVEVPR